MAVITTGVSAPAIATAAARHVRSGRPRHALIRLQRRGPPSATALKPARPALLRYAAASPDMVHIWMEMVTAWHAKTRPGRQEPVITEVPQLRPVTPAGRTTPLRTVCWSRHLPRSLTGGSIATARLPVQLRQH